MKKYLLLHKKHFSAQVACRCSVGTPVIVHNATYLTPPHPNGGVSPAAHIQTYPAGRWRHNGLSLGSLLKYRKRSRFSTKVACGYSLGNLCISPSALSVQERGYTAGYPICILRIQGAVWRSATGGMDTSLRLGKMLKPFFFDGALHLLGMNSNVLFNATRQGVFDTHLLSGMSNYSSV